MSTYKSEKQEDLNMIFCPPKISAETTEEFKNLSKNWALEPITLHIFNFEKTLEISPNAFQPFVLFKQMLKNDNKFMFSLNLNNNLLQDIKARGLEQIFNPVKSIHHAKVKAGLRAKGNIDVEFINPFLSATKQTLSVQAQTEIQPLKPYIKSKNIPYQVNIAGVISLISDHFTGSITLCFPSETFLNIYNKMFDEQNTKINSEIEDAAGELLNIIYGQSKAELNDKKGYQLKKAIPTVLTADKLRIRQQGSGPTVVLPFDSIDLLDHELLMFQLLFVFGYKFLPEPPLVVPVLVRFLLKNSRSGRHWRIV
ncbi:MAG: chemotaxis protein CheX [Bdellovibrionales bacterium]|nr:chemotaxis protein CheX [Bdellovibrionales bacterium]